MNKPVLIGLTGKAGSGKDTTYTLIEEWCENNGLTAKRDAFADRLKISAAHALGVMKDELTFCNELKREGVTIHIEADFVTEGWNLHLTGREFLQYYGTEAHREVFDYDFWVDAVLPLGPDDWTMPNWQYNFYTLPENEPADICVVTDVRFENEAQRIRDLGGRNWRIDRDVPDVEAHASEAGFGLELIDLVVSNEGTIDDLRETIDFIMFSSFPQSKEMVSDGG